jgi:hypothetical protein
LYHEGESESGDDPIKKLVSEMGFPPQRTNALEAKLKDPRAALQKERLLVHEHLGKVTTDFVSDKFDPKVDAPEYSTSLGELRATLLLHFVEVALPTLTPAERSRLTTLFKDHSED